MPGKNPKHQKKKIIVQRQQKFSNFKMNTRFLVMAIIFVGVIIAVIAIVINYKNEKSELGDTVEDNDLITVNYKMWADLDHDTKIDWRNESVYKEDSSWIVNVSKENIQPVGLYYNILYMRLNEKKQIPLPNNVDMDGNGKDDVTGKDLESYAGTHDELFNTSLLYDVTIINMTKASKEDTTKEFNLNVQEIILGDRVITIRTAFTPYIMISTDSRFF